MVIQWYGQSCFKIQSGELVIVIDPFSKEIGLTPPRFKTDIVMVTHSHLDHSNHESLSGDPVLVMGPGEYEIKGVNILGMQTFHDDQNGKERGVNTIYKIKIEDISLLHLGDFGEKEIRNETLENIGEVDILMAPVGGKYTIDGEEAAKLIKRIEPKFVIPMHYKITGLKIKDLDSADNFLKETGATKTETQEKMVIKKKDISEDQKMKIVVLKPI